MMGVKFNKGEKCIFLYFQMDFNEYEQYFIVSTEEGRLAVDPEIWWQNEVCANERLNILTGEEVE